MLNTTKGRHFRLSGLIKCILRGLSLYMPTFLGINPEEHYARLQIVLNCPKANKKGF